MSRGEKDDDDGGVLLLKGGCCSCVVGPPAAAEEEDDEAEAAEAAAGRLSWCRRSSVVATARRAIAEDAREARSMVDCRVVGWCSFVRGAGETRRRKEQKRSAQQSESLLSFGKRGKLAGGRG